MGDSVSGLGLRGADTDMMMRGPLKDPGLGVELRVW